MGARLLHKEPDLTTVSAPVLAPLIREPRIPRALCPVAIGDAPLLGSLDRDQLESRVGTRTLGSCRVRYEHLLDSGCRSQPVTMADPTLEQLMTDAFAPAYLRRLQARRR